MLDSLSYCSRGRPDLDDEALRQIIAVSRRNNAIHGITGLLVYGSGLYFQWLEGPPQALQNLMAKICRDPRHDSVVILGTNFDEPERVFPQWDMEPVGPEEIHEVLVDAIGSIKTESNGALLERLLDHIRGVVNAADS
ncbi:MAG: BLUF domain-containing protein [Betaproteobacteria bacterium]|jgi:hypothetical protein|nr:BLUF domain-containing protein [Betaproteobacteria bacterium]